jgi:hypothetical protein
MSTARRLVTQRDFKSRRPSPLVLRQMAEELEKLEPDEHLSSNPKFKGLKYIGLSTFARDQLIQKLRECADFVENPQSVAPMLYLGK